MKIYNEELFFGDHIYIFSKGCKKEYTLVQHLVYGHWLFTNKPFITEYIDKGRMNEFLDYKKYEITPRPKFEQNLMLGGGCCC
jgi:hypothetical protein